MSWPLDDTPVKPLSGLNALGSLGAQPVTMANALRAKPLTLAYDMSTGRESTNVIDQRNSPPESYTPQESFFQYVVRDFSDRWNAIQKQREWNAMSDAEQARIKQNLYDELAKALHGNALAPDLQKSK